MGRWCMARRRARARRAWGCRPWAWRAGVRRVRPSGRRARVVVRPGLVAVRLAVVTAVAGATVLLPGATAPAADAADGYAYAFADGARRIEGATGTADAVALEPGTTYRSSLPRSGTVHFRLELDAASNAYASVTAVPAAGAAVTAADGIRMSVRDADGSSCSSDSVSFGAARSPRPLTAWGMREISPGGLRCQEPGTYYVTVERIRPQDSPPDPWALELATATEPGLERTGATSAPGTWDSSSPEPVTGEPERRRGGSGFADATAVAQGVWRDDVRPGQTLFYKVPVDWGRQLYATAELGSAGGGSGYAPGALSLTLHNPVRGEVDDAATGYAGRRATADLSPVPPVAHANRHAAADQVSGMRFAGEYYLVVHLAEGVAEDFGEGPFGLTLRVRIKGGGQGGPGYDGEPVPRGVFEVAGRAAASEGGAASDDLAMKAVAVGGIGTGSALLVGLGVWTVVARRRGPGPRPGSPGL
ncbi:hypothetical protein [Streptomyces griseicoloratus]|uniref:hypothetical protein n=1 Tax=Streptomyces griseicoloratus TaxID=2752516 RepID=UPI00359CAD10